MNATPGGTDRPRIPGTVWVLGCVSLLMDVSSEMVQSLLPLFLTLQLGVSAAGLGLLEGLAVATAMASRLGSGVVADRLRSRKHLLILGYGLGALSKPVIPLAGSLVPIIGARFLDRLGKGIRSAPRDALIAEVTPPAIRGAAFGLRKSLDTLGGFGGPLLAVGLMTLLANDYRAVFWYAVIPAMLAVALLAFGLHEPRPEALPAQGNGPLVAPLPIPLARQLRESAALNPPTWGFIVLAAGLTFARFSEAFLLLRSEGVGVPATYVPLVLVLMHLVYGALAYPAGVLSDRIGSRGLLQLSLVSLVGANLALANAAGLPGLVTGIVLWGVHMGLSQGLLAAFIGGSAPAHLKATAFGMFHLSLGVAALFGNLTAGILWEWYSPQATFGVSAALAAVSLVAFSVWRPPPRT